MYCSDESVSVLFQIGRPSRQNKKCSFISCVKAEWREVGTTVTVAPCDPIILCAPLPYTNLVWQVLQVARES